jgi:hypothetical protein
VNIAGVADRASTETEVYLAILPCSPRPRKRGTLHGRLLLTPGFRLLNSLLELLVLLELLYLYLLFVIPELQARVHEPWIYPPFRTKL